MEFRFKTCAATGCERNAHRDAEGKQGYCSLHYQRFKRHGDPEIVKRTPSPAKDWLLAHAGYGGDECLPWPWAVGNDGYGRVHEFSNGGLTTASRLMCRVAHGEPPTPNLEAAHSCGRGDQGCVNPRHLYWATSARNHADKVEHGTTNRGERQGRSKLTEQDVREIRESGSTPAKDLAARFGVDASVISHIRHRRAWDWLP